MMYDVIIIGGGLSGLMAAKTAADKGLKALVLAKGMGRIHAFMSGIDLLGYYPANSAEVLENVQPGLKKLIDENPNHPYSKVGLEDIESSLKAFSKMYNPKSYHYIEIAGKNIILPTGIGTLKPSYLIPSTMISGKDIFSEPTLLISFSEFENFYSAYAAKALTKFNTTNKNPPIRWKSITISDIVNRHTFKPAALAIQFEEDRFIRKLAKNIRELRTQENLIGFPAILGLNNAEKVKSDLEEGIGARVFELSTLPPSVPGMRLFNLFKEDLRHKGVRMIIGAEAISAIKKNGRCQGIILKTPVGEKFLEANFFVLATGRFFGGGLQAHGDCIVEPLFKLPVEQPKIKDDWFDYEFLGEMGHLLNRSGIRTNSRLNPIDENGKVLFENLFVAGSILGHHDCLREKSSGGVDISTGYKVIKNLIQ
jgi:glycerol-3-phosphate dehydrogenase subunit B